MRLLNGLILLGAVAASSPLHAAIIQYQFTGTISAAPAGTSLLLGDAFTGNWSIDTNQPGQSVSSLGFNGRQYELGSLRIDLNGESAAVQGGAVFVSESSVDSAFLGIWPSGFSSDYVVSVVSQGLQRWGANIWRTQIVFSYDGLGIWNNLELPGAFDFLHNAVGGVIRLETLGGELGSGVIIGRIDSIAATTVPLNSPTYLLASALSWLAFRSKQRRKLPRTST